MSYYAKKQDTYDKLQRDIEKFFFDCKVLIWCEPNKTRDKSFDTWIQPEIECLHQRIDKFERTRDGNVLEGQILKSIIREEATKIRDMLYDLHFYRKIPIRGYQKFDCGVEDKKFTLSYVDDRTRAPIIPEWREE